MNCPPRNPDRGGRFLARALGTRRFRRLLEPYGCSWSDGGCLTLALLLAGVTGGEVMLVGSAGRIVHAFVRCADGVCLDGDGATTLGGMLEKTARLYGLAAVSIAGVSVARAAARLNLPIFWSVICDGSALFPELYRRYLAFSSVKRG